MIITLNKEFTIELESGKTATAEVIITATFDTSYGADADGNRGSSGWFIDDIEFAVPETYDDGSLMKEGYEFAELLNEVVDEYEWSFSA